MSNSPSSSCQRCGRTLPEDAPHGICPQCLVAMNFASMTAVSGEMGVGTKPAPSPEELAPHFPQLEILGFLGRGGMGVVYKARQKALGRLVALKLLAPEREHDEKFAARFVREARALATLDHPNIVTVHDFGQANGFFFLLMEYVDGLNLRQILQARKLTPEEALGIVPSLCDALQFAHERGVVHRDIKPENLLLAKDGRVKVADFGVAKIVGDDVSAEEGVGTPAYMAPEQKETPRKSDNRADIYSLGVVFYEMLTGELPKDKIVPPSRRVSVDVRVDEVVLRALETSPELRWQTAASFRTGVETCTGVNSQTSATRGHDFSNSAVRKGAENTVSKRKILAGGIAVLLAMAALAGGSWWATRHARSAPTVGEGTIVRITPGQAVLREVADNSESTTANEDPDADAKAKLRTAQEEFQRISELRAQKVVSEAEWDRAKYRTLAGESLLQGDRQRFAKISEEYSKRVLARLDAVLQEHVISPAEHRQGVADLNREIAQAESDYGRSTATVGVHSSPVTLVGRSDTGPAIGLLPPPVSAVGTENSGHGTSSQPGQPPPASKPAQASITWLYGEWEFDEEATTKSAKEKKVDGLSGLVYAQLFEQLVGTKLSFTEKQLTMTTKNGNGKVFAIREARSAGADAAVVTQGDGEVTTYHRDGNRLWFTSTGSAQAPFYFKRMTTEIQPPPIDLPPQDAEAQAAPAWLRGVWVLDWDATEEKNAALPNFSDQDRADYLRVASGLTVEIGAHKFTRKSKDAEPFELTFSAVEKSDHSTVTLEAKDGKVITIHHQGDGVWVREGGDANMALCFKRKDGALKILPEPARGGDAGEQEPAAKPPL